MHIHELRLGAAPHGVALELVGLVAAGAIVPAVAPVVVVVVDGVGRGQLLLGPLLLQHRHRLRKVTYYILHTSVAHPHINICQAVIQNGSRETGFPRAFLNGQFRLR